MRMRNHDKIEDDEVLKEAGRLSAIPKRDPYVVPENFFNRFESDILEKVKNLPKHSNPEEKKKPIFVSISEWFFQWKIAAPALVLLMIGIGIGHYTTWVDKAFGAASTDKVSDEQLRQNLAQTSDAEIKEYVEKNSDSFDESLLSEYANIYRADLKIHKKELDPETINAIVDELDESTITEQFL